MSSTPAPPNSPVRVNLLLPATPPRSPLKMILRIRPTHTGEGKEQSGTATQKGAVKPTKNKSRSVKRSIRELKAIMEAARRAGQKDKTSQLGTGRLILSEILPKNSEARSNHSWTGPPSIAVRTENDILVTAWAKQEVLPKQTRTNLAELTFTYPISPPTSEIFGRASPPSTVRDHPLSPGPEIPSMAGTPESEVNMANNDDDPMTFYFAYGTDLSISFMEYAYPGIQVVSPATLPNFKWLIGSRNKPIVIPSPTDEVDGILYLIPTSHIDLFAARTHKHGAAIPVHLNVKLYEGGNKNGVNAGRGFGGLGSYTPSMCTATVFVAEGPETEGVLEGKKGAKMIRKMRRGILEAEIHGLDLEWSEWVLTKMISVTIIPEEAPEEAN